MPYDGLNDPSVGLLIHSNLVRIPCASASNVLTYRIFLPYSQLECENKIQLSSEQDKEHFRYIYTIHQEENHDGSGGWIIPGMWLIWVISENPGFALTRKCLRRQIWGGVPSPGTIFFSIFMRLFWIFLQNHICHPPSRRPLSALRAIQDAPQVYRHWLMLPSPRWYMQYLSLTKAQRSHQQPKNCKYVHVQKKIFFFANLGEMDYLRQAIQEDFKYFPKE